MHVCVTSCTCPVLGRFYSVESCFLSPATSLVTVVRVDWFLAGQLWYKDGMSLYKLQDNICISLSNIHAVNESLIDKCSAKEQKVLFMEEMNKHFHVCLVSRQYGDRINKTMRQLNVATNLVSALLSLSRHLKENMSAQSGHYRTWGNMICRCENYAYVHYLSKHHNHIRELTWNSTLFSFI